MLIQSVDEHAEGQVTLKFGRAPRQHELAVTLGKRAKLTQQTRLADPGLAHHRKSARTPAREGGKRIARASKLRNASDKDRSRLSAGHRTPSTTREPNASVAARQTRA